MWIYRQYILEKLIPDSGIDAINLNVFTRYNTNMFRCSVEMYIKIKKVASTKLIVALLS